MEASGPRLLVLTRALFACVSGVADAAVEVTDVDFSGFLLAFLKTSPSVPPDPGLLDTAGAPSPVFDFPIKIVKN